MSKLAGYAVAAGLVTSVSRETIRQILRAAGISWQAAKTWKASADPGFIAKMRRVLSLYDHPPTDGRVVCADLYRHCNYAYVLALRASLKGSGWPWLGIVTAMRISAEAD